MNPGPPLPTSRAKAAGCSPVQVLAVIMVRDRARPGPDRVGHHLRKGNGGRSRRLWPRGNSEWRPGREEARRLWGLSEPRRTPLPVGPPGWLADGTRLRVCAGAPNLNGWCGEAQCGSQADAVADWRNARR